jgi:acetolactate synthase-1/2/3 large subunit
MHPAWVSHCLNRIKDDDSIVMTESAFSMAQMDFTSPGTFFSGGAGGGLGYGLGMSLGAKLAAKDRFVICTQGDGAYMYGNPIPAHYVGRAEKLPTLTVIMNNEQWGAVKRNTRAMYPDGFAARSNREPLTFFEGDMAYEKAAEIAGGYGERVTDPAELPGALDRAADAVRGQGKSAVLNVSTI